MASAVDEEISMSLHEMLPRLFFVVLILSLVKSYLHELQSTIMKQKNGKYKLYIV